MSSPEEIAAGLSPERLDAALLGLLRQIPDLAVAAAQAEAPVGKREVEIGPVRHEVGEVRDSIGPLLDEGTMRAGAHTDDAVALLVHEGTAPHEIKPRHQLPDGRIGYLAFAGGGGETAFARVVHHPGTQPNPFMERALERIEPQIAALAEQAGAEFFTGVK